MTVTRTTVDGHDAYAVESPALRLVTVPGAGAKISHLTDRRTGREWCWHHAGGPVIVPAGRNDEFEIEHQWGIDECVPSIAREIVDGYASPDHGAVWSAAWTVIEAVGRLRLRCAMPSCGLEIERTVSVDGAGLRLDWRLLNRRGRPARYIWSWHPLLAWRQGDRIELPGTAEVIRRRWVGRMVVESVPWPCPEPGVDLGAGELGRVPACGKSFARATGTAALAGVDGSRLELAWDPLVLPWVGLWTMRGGGAPSVVDADGRKRMGLGPVHHWAIEPANACRDGLSRMTGETPPENRLGAGGERSWSIRLSA